MAPGKFFFRFSPNEKILFSFGSFLKLRLAFFPFCIERKSESPEDDNSCEF